MRTSSAPPFQSTVASVLLDALRGLAALLVCMHHWRYLFFLDYPLLVAHRKLLFVPYLICSMGHQAVIIFFVLSGYLVGGHVLRALATGRWSWRVYLLQRGVRLWVVLLPALALGGLLDFAAFHFHLAPKLYAGLVHDYVTYNVPSHFTWVAFAGNAFFVQSILTPVFGSNGALWSLANEFWYYILFPLGLLAFRSHYSLPIRLALAALCVAVMVFVGHGILVLFPVWMLGVLLAVTPIRSTPAWTRWLALMVYLPFAAAVIRGNIVRHIDPDYALGIATFGLLWVLLGAQRPAEDRWYVRPSRTVAGFSYTLYLVHTPMLMLLTALFAGETRWTPDPHHLLIAFPLLFGVVLYGYGVALLTEFHTTAVRDWAMRRLPR